MFGAFSKFWIKNPMLTNIFIIVSIIIGALSWFMVPKQYKPDIVQPAYLIVIPAPGYDSTEIANYVVRPFQKKMNEIMGVESINASANKDYASLTVKFEGGIDNEVAFNRLTNKLTNSLSVLPTWTKMPVVRSLDINDIPVYTFAIVDSSKDQSKENRIVMKKIANAIMDDIQAVPNVSAQYLVGGDDNDVNITVDLEKLEAKNTDLMQVYAALKAANVKFPGGTYAKGGVNNVITIDSSLNDAAKISSIVVNLVNNSPVLISDVATVTRGISTEKYRTFINTGSGQQNAVYIGVAKKRGSNSITVIEGVQKKVEEIKAKLPAGFSLVEVQNEGIIAQEKTSRLLKELGNTVLILFIALSIFLGFKDAFGSALSVPIVLALVFGIAYITGDNINQITLFALILALGMLVDDSIVVVENISRHLEMPGRKKGILPTIIDAVEEIGPAVILSTVTKILSFVGLFFMSGLFGQYTGPLPKYITASLLLSIAVALIVNPYVSYLFETHKEKKLKKAGKLESHEHHEKSPGKMSQYYTRLMHWFLATGKRRWTIKILFFVFLGLFLLFPSFEFVKQTSLPPSNDSTIYLWIDTPRNAPFSETEKLAEDINQYFSRYLAKNSEEKVSKKDLRVIESMSYWVGIAPSLENATVSLGGISRSNENNISIRFNLLHETKREVITSDYIQMLRSSANEFFAKHPNLKVRYQLPPTGPATDATFLVKIQGEPNESVDNVEAFTAWFKTKIAPIVKYHAVYDYIDSAKGYQNQYKIRLNPEYVSRLGLTSEQVVTTIYSIFNKNSIGLFNDDKSSEELHINILTPDIQKNDPNILEKITFTNKVGKKILLSEIADISIEPNDKSIDFFNGLPTMMILGDVSGSAQYPMKNIIGRLKAAEFWEGKYVASNITDLGCDVREVATGKTYKVILDGSWKMSVDTNRNLGTILIAALLMLYVLVSGNFKSYKAGGVLMLTFLLGFYGIMPGFAVLYALDGTYMSATSTIGVISIAGIVIGNGIIFLEYYLQLRKEGQANKDALVNAGLTRMRPIILTSLTAIIGAIMIAEDPVWGGLAYVLIFGLAASATLMLLVIPVFIHDIYEGKNISDE